MRTHHKRTATTPSQEHPRLQKPTRPTHSINTETLRENERKPNADLQPPDKRFMKRSYQTTRRPMDNTKVKRRGADAMAPSNSTGPIPSQGKPRLGGKDETNAKGRTRTSHK